MLRTYYPFIPIPSSTPGFDVVLSTGSTLNAIENSSGRQWLSGPTGKSIRLSETSGVDYRVAMGTSTVDAALTGSMLVLGGVVEVFNVPAGGYISIMTTSTAISTVNVALGYGQ